MSNNINKPSVRREAAGLSQRLDAVEQNLARVLFNLNQRFQAIDSQLQNANLLIQALTEHVGKDLVAATAEEIRVERLRANAEVEKNALEKGIADGYVSKSEKVDDTSILVGRYVSAKGDVQEPGRVQMTMPTVDPKFQAQLKDKGAGTSLDLPDGSKFELLEIYAVDTEKYRKLEEEKAKKAAEDAEKAVAASAEVAAQDEQADGAEAPASDSAPAAETAPTAAQE